MNGIIITKAFLCIVFAGGLISCHSRDSSDPSKVYFPVVDYLKGQIKQTDAASHRFVRITNEGAGDDTSVVSHDVFKSLSRQFVNIPDIASRKYRNDYSEAQDFDELLNNVLLMYTAKKEKSEVRSQTVMMQPDETGNTRVKTILIHMVTSRGDIVIEKNMTWHVGRRFQVVTKTNTAQQPEKISTVMVMWE